MYKDENFHNNHNCPHNLIDSNIWKVHAAKQTLISNLFNHSLSLIFLFKQLFFINVFCFCSFPAIRFQIVKLRLRRLSKINLHAITQTDVDTINIRKNEQNESHLTKFSHLHPKITPVQTTPHCLLLGQKDFVHESISEFWKGHLRIIVLKQNQERTFLQWNMLNVYRHDILACVMNFQGQIQRKVHKRCCFA